MEIDSSVYKAQDHIYQLARQERGHLRLPNNLVSYPKCSLLHSWPGKRLTDCGIAIRHELDGTGFESQWGEIFCPVRFRGQTSLPYDG